jgi:glycosyltransferase involved in cell wall biosynthesis
MTKPRVFIGFSETSCYCAGLKRGFDDIGVPCVCFMVGENRFQFEDLGSGRLLALIRSILKKRETLQARSKATGNWLVKAGCALGRLTLALAQNVVWLAVLVWALAKFDVFILHGRASFINIFRLLFKPRFLDLALLKLFGKKIIYVFHGADTRPAYLTGSSSNRRLNARQLIKYTRRQAQDLRIIERYADAVIHYPLNTPLFRRKVVSHEFLGRTAFVAPSRAEPHAARPGRPINIVHAPSDPVVKGTERIRAIIARLRQKGHAIDLIELIGRKNQEVKDCLRDCDFLVDQAYYDVAISYLATEAAFLGKPAVIGSYALPALRKTTPRELWPPVVMCLPDEMEQAIEELILDSERRLRLGAQAKEFVETHYGPPRVARNFLRLIHNDVPEEWLFDPATLEYCHGYGYAEEDERARIREVVQEGGESALFLDDKPVLKEKMLLFAFGDTPANARGPAGSTQLEPQMDADKRR